MKRVLRLKHTNDIGATGGFCMRVGSVIEFYDGGFRSPEVNKSYYPLFGPYIFLNDIANRLADNIPGDYSQYFEVSDVSGTIIPKVTHDIIDENGAVVNNVSHAELMVLLMLDEVKILRADMDSDEEDKFKIAKHA
jgi:hypothetical protein